MAEKYGFQPRRGWKYDADPTTGLSRNDWKEYETKPNHIPPQEGELVLEFDNGIPRMKIGDGIRKFTELPYLSIDSFILPTHASVTIYGSEDADNADKPQWQDDTDESGNARYKQFVTVNNATITPNSKVDLQPTPAQLSIFHDKDLTFVAENDEGTVAIYCVGQKPANTYRMQCTVTEVVQDG